MTKRVHAVVSGRVQGVGFRAFVAHWAESQGLAGWVRNLPYSRQVELEVQGPDDAVDDLIRGVGDGPLGARVESVISEPCPLDRGGDMGFHVR
jgi:acylphosphatase